MRLRAMLPTIAVALVAVTMLATTAACGGGEPSDVRDVFDDRVPGSIDGPTLVFVFTDN